MQKIINLEKLLVNLGEVKGSEKLEKTQERESRSNYTVKFEDEEKTPRNEQKSARLSNILNQTPKKTVSK